MRRNELVSKIMTPSPITVHTGQSLVEAKALLTEHQFHHVPVVSGKKLVGMMSSTDVLRVSYEYGTDAEHQEVVLDPTRTIENVMATELTTIDSHATIRETAGIFAEGAFHSLPVTAKDGTLVGIVTTTDLIQYLLEQY